MTTRNEAVTVIRLDVGQVPAGQAQVERAFTSMAKTGEASAGQIKAAMRSLPAQFTDVATSLAGGANPLLVLLQQGGQVRDQFGSLGAALRGIGSFITPATLGVGAVAALGAVLIEAGRDSARLRDALILTNNAAGLTADRLDEISRTVAENGNVTQGAARDIITTLAQQGTVSARVLDSTALAVARVADVSGKTREEVARDFATMGKNVADWAATHNQAWNFLTADQYKYIKSLEDQGRAEEAAIYVNKQIITQMDAQRQSLGLLEGAWKKLQSAASDAWQAMLNVGRPDTVGQQLDKVSRQIASFEENLPGANVDSSRRAAIMAQLQALKDEQRRLMMMSDRERTNAIASSDKAAQEQRKIEALRTADKGGGKSPKVDRNDWSAGRVIDPFGDFIRSERGATDEVNQSLRQRIERGLEEARRGAAKAEQDARQAEAKRLAGQADLLQSLIDANAKANVDMIADDQERALAQIELDRRVMQRRIDAVTEAGSAERAAAEQLADEQTGRARQVAAAKFVRDTSAETREQVRDALALAFQDTKDPLRAFGDALGNIVFQRVSTSLADALVTAAIGSGKPGSDKGFIGDLFDIGMAVFGGARAGGGPVDAGKAYLVGERGPEVVLMGRQSGRVVSNEALRAGGRSSMPAINLSPVINIDARSDQAQIAQLVGGAMAQTQRDMWAALHARGLA